MCIVVDLVSILQLDRSKFLYFSIFEISTLTQMTIVNLLT